MLRTIRFNYVSVNKRQRPKHFKVLASVWAELLILSLHVLVPNSNFMYKQRQSLKELQLPTVTVRFHNFLLAGF